MLSFMVIALDGFPLVESGDNITAAIVDTVKKNGLELEDGDVLVIAQKVFSKAEKRVINLKNVIPSTKAMEIAEITGKDARFEELVLGETRKIVKVSRDTVLVEDKRGLICINAGIDKSNVKGRGNFALLPENPDESARKCRQAIKELCGKNVAVIVSDTYSRPFRRGQVNYAIGFAGIKPFRDYRGKKDLFGQLLRVKNVAVVDEIAAAAELVMGQGTEKRPVIILRGLADAVESCEKCVFGDLLISAEEDLFRNAL